MRSAFMPDRMYWKPLPSSPIRLAAGTSMSSKNSALVEWFIIMRSGRISRPLRLRMSIRKTLRPSMRRFTCSAGVVQAQLAAGDLRQVLLLLRVAAVAQHGAHDVHLRVAGRGAAAV